jgi:FXSXX-COOH protein
LPGLDLVPADGWHLAGRAAAARLFPSEVPSGCHACPLPSLQYQHDGSETAMTTIHLPDDQPQPDGPARVPLARLARGGVSPVLTRIVPKPAERGPGRVAVAAFQSSV